MVVVVVVVGDPMGKWRGKYCSCSEHDGRGERVTGLPACLSLPPPLPGLLWLRSTPSLAWALMLARACLGAGPCSQPLFTL